MADSLFLPTTYIYDVDSLSDETLKDPNFKELLIRLRQSTNDMNLAINAKDTAYYSTTEFIPGQLYFPNPGGPSPDYRTVIRKVINFGALPNAALKQVAHNIVGIGAPTTFSATRIYAAATDQVAPSFIPIPFASPVLADNIALEIDAVNVNITTGSNRTNYTLCYVVFEYITN